MAVTTSSGNGFALYNGVKLPVLPEYDVQTYPVCTISRDVASAYGAEYLLFLGSYAIAMYDPDLDVWSCGGLGPSLLYLYKNGVWEQYPDDNVGMFFIQVPEIIGDDGTVEMTAIELVWTKADILAENGTVWAAASATIPLDGMNVIEWDGDTTGLESVSIGCKVSDEVIDKETAQKGIVVMSDNTISDTGMHFELSGDVFALETGAVCIVYKDGVTVDGETVEHKGVYFLYGALYTKLFAYPASGESEPTYDRTAFLSGLAMGLCGKGNPTFEGSGKMLYNGVELPDIKSVWTGEVKAENPYAMVIWFNREIEAVELIISNLPFRVLSSSSYDSICGASGSDILIYGKYKHETAWRFVGKHSPATGLEVMKLPSGIIWTSHEITNNSDITVSTSDPVPIEDAFSKGYHVGAALRRKRVLPVAYLYNGVRLPKLPEWDKVAHPYALIRTQWNNDDGSFRLAYFNTFASNARYNPSDSGGCIFGGRDGGESVAGQACSITSPDGSWGSLTTYDDGSVVIPPPEGSDFRGIYTEYLTWANFKVKYDGVVYMEASEPIPVYE